MKINNKNKRALIIFLVLVIFFFNIKETYAFDLVGTLLGIASPVISLISSAASGIFKAIAYLVHNLFFFLNNYIAAPTVDRLHNLNPFYETTTPLQTGSTEQSKKTINSPAKVLWSILRNFSYIILVFAALLAGFQWLLGEDRASQALIFKIIIVAFLINFTFTFVKEGFLIVYNIEKGLTGNIEGGSLGTLIAGSLWQSDPISQIKAAIPATNEENKISKNFSETIGYFSIVFFDMIIFVILIITAILLLTRFIMIIFLAATSSFAIVSLAFPKFEKGALAQLTSKLGFFDSWLNQLINWLIIIPIFSILVILGNILKENVLSQSSVTGFFEFAVVLAVLAVWYAMSIKVAKNLSGKIGEFAQKLAFGALAGLGGLFTGVISGVGKGIGFLGKPLFGEALDKVGSLVSKLPVNRFTAPFVKKVGTLKEKGTQLKEKAYKDVSEAAQMKMSVLLDKYKTSKDPEILKKINNLLEKGKDNPYIAESILDPLSKADSETINNLFKDSNFSNNFSQIIQRKDLTEKSRQSINNIFPKLNADTLVDKMLDQNFIAMLNQADSEIRNAFYNAIKNLDKNKLLKELNKGLKSKNLNLDYFNIPEVKDLTKTLNERFNGLISAALSANANQISAALSKNLELFENVEEIKELVRKSGAKQPDTLTDSALNSVFLSNPDKVLDVINGSDIKNIQSFIMAIRSANGYDKGKVIAKNNNFSPDQIRKFYIAYQLAKMINFF